jgi:hypothetical protein
LPTTYDTLAFEFFEKQVEERSGSVLVVLNGEVREAKFYEEYFEYSDAQNLCGNSSFLPQQPFRILGPSFLYKKIFWLAEDPASKIYYRNEKITYMPTNDAREYCAFSMLSEVDSNHGGTIVYRFLCKDDLRDSEGRFILFKNETVSCDPFKITRESLVDYHLGDYDYGLNKTYVFRELVDTWKIGG